MKISEAQKLIKKTYGHKDRQRGHEGTFMYLIEEVGELATEIREGDKESIASEFADVLAWTLSVAELHNIDVEEAFKKKYNQCSGCQQLPCTCKTKP